MAKVKVNVTNVEPSEYKQPTPGLYTAKIEEANLRDEDGKNDIELVLAIQGGEFDKAKLWTYIGLTDASAWKMRELIDALGLPTEIELDTNKHLVNKKLKVKVNGDQWQGEYRARVGRLAPLDATAVEDPDAPATEEAPAAEAADAAEDYNTWSIEDLVSTIAEDADLLAHTPGINEEGAVGEDDKDWLVGFLEAADDSSDALDAYLAESPWDEDASASQTAEKPDYSTWSVDEIKAEIERRSIDAPKRAPKSKLIGLLETDDASGDPFEGTS